LGGENRIKILHCLNLVRSCCIRDNNFYALDKEKLVGNLKLAIQITLNSNNFTRSKTISNKLYVGNLSFSVREDSFSELFSDCGSVNSTKIITDRDSGRSKGFGFVEMSSSEEAEEVISKYDGFEIDGRAMNISVAKPQENRNSNSGFRSNRIDIGFN
jgi:cold-inducible RNA-binding protein